VHHLAHRAGREDGRAAVVVPLPVAAQERHADETRAARDFAHHGAVARLEDVERERHAREEDDVREREDRMTSAAS